MKKEFVFGLIFLFLFVIVSNVHAATDADILVAQAEGLQNNISAAQDLINSPDKDKIVSDYLKKEWGKILETKPIFREIMATYKQISPYTDPVFNWAVGMVPSLSWLFIITFLIWFTFMRYSWIIFDFIKEIGLFETTAAIIYTAFMVLVLVTEKVQVLSVWLANLLIGFISITFGTWWGQTILVVGTILVLTLLNMFNKTFRVYLRKMRMEKYQAKIKKVAKEEEKEMKEKNK